MSSQSIICFIKDPIFINRPFLLDLPLNLRFENLPALSASFSHNSYVYTHRHFYTLIASYVILLWFSASLYSWIPADVPKARAFMQYNLAVCYSMRGEYDRAMATLAQVNSHLHSLYLRIQLALTNIFLHCIFFSVHSQLAHHCLHRSTFSDYIWI